MNWVNAETGKDDAYSLWYGFSGEGYSDGWEDNETSFHIIRDIKEKSKEESITHMSILTTIPPKLDKLAPNLTHLCLTGIEQEIFSQFQRWINLKNLEVLVLSDNEFTDNRLPKGVTSIKSLKKLKLTGCELHELPSSMSNLYQLESLVLSSKTLETIEVIGTMPSLRELELTEMHDLSAIPESLSGLVNLEVLHLRLNYPLPAGIPEIFSQMVSLRDLDISFNELTSLPMSLANLTALEVFKARNNNLKRSGIPDIFGKMDSLRVLDLHMCKIEGLPLSIAKLVKLEELDLYGNQLSSDALEIVCESLPWLKQLDIRANGITRLPESMSKMEQLEDLDISNNDFSSPGLPDIFSGLIALQYLNIRNAHISTLPPSIGTLDKLTKLDVSGNEFTKLPVCLHKLTSLRELLLSGNKSLQSLDIEIVKLPNLTNIRAFRLASMRTPPSEVCAKGLSAIKEYYGV